MSVVCMCIYVCRYTCPANCRGQKSSLCVFCGCLPSFVSDRVSHWTVSSLFHLGQLFSDAPGSSSLHLLSTGLKVLVPTSSFCAGAGDAKSGSHACISAHPLDHFPSPSRFLFSKMFLKVVKVYFRTTD